MKSEPRIQSNEIYRCVYCDKVFKYIEVHNGWRCPICYNYLYIKISVDNFEHTGQRVHPKDLSVGEIITLENDFIYEILDISMRGDNYRIALKKLRAIEFTPDSVITRIEGGWY